MKKTVTQKMVWIAVILTLLVAFAGLAWSQLIPEVTVRLFEAGSLVGEVYVPDRAEGQTQYTEHWILYRNYQYPGPRYVGELLVAPIPSVAPYSSDADFFRNAPFPSGSKYVKVDVQEFTTLPVTR